MPAVSIIVPAYNAAAFIDGTLKRIAAQTLRDIEVVVVDDGSSDGTAEVIAAAARRHPKIRPLTLPENSGVSMARRAALAASTGSYVWLVDSDDHAAPRGAEELIAAARRTGADAVIARADFVYDEGRARRPVSSPAPGTYTRAEAFRHLLTGSASGHLWNKLFRRELLEGAEFVPARTHSDLALTATALARADRVAAVAAHVYDYRIRPGSLITARRSRAASLEVVGAAVERAAAAAGIPHDDADLDYFRCRYLTLSAVKDLVQTEMDPERLRQLRSRIGARELRAIVGRRDARRLALALSAKLSLPAHRMILRAAQR